jgi:plastocyanin
MKRFLLPLLACMCLTLLLALIVSCGSTSNSSSTNEVHLTDTNFAQPTVTLQKGQHLILINDTSTIHVIANGTWDAVGNARPHREAGAPLVNDETVSGNGQLTIGPFTNAGTFQLFCTIHPNMNLTVTVK